MKISALISSIFGLLCSVFCLHAQPAPVSANADYAAFIALDQAAPPGELGPEKYLTWLDGRQQAMKSSALAFSAAHPADPRRWELVMACVKYPPLFIKNFGSDVATKGAGAIIADEPAKAEWRKQSEALIQAMLASTDAPQELQEEQEWIRFATDFRATTAARSKGEPVDYSAFPTRFDAHVAKYVQLDILAARAANYLGALERELKVPGPTLEGWRHLLDAPNAALCVMAAGQLRMAELKTKSMEMTFTAADGRAVDLKSLRGKVVLIDFWATWCGPCVAELPNVRKVYAAYHDKGFEVVGIALENGKLTPKDTPEQVVTKLETAKTILTDFTAKEAMPWPQYFDGKYWKTDIATQYAIQSIPAMFLLDQEGKVVSTNARGELLEKEVRRLLKL